MPSLGKLLLVTGLMAAAVGALLLLGDRFPWLRLGHLPGDIVVERARFRLHLPVGTSVLLSLLLSLLLWLLSGRR